MACLKFVDWFGGPRWCRVQRRKVARCADTSNSPALPDQAHQSLQLRKNPSADTVIRVLASLSKYANRDELKARE